MTTSWPMVGVTLSVTVWPETLKAVLASCRPLTHTCRSLVGACTTVKIRLPVLVKVSK